MKLPIHGHKWKSDICILLISLGNNFTRDWWLRSWFSPYPWPPYPWPPKLDFKLQSPKHNLVTTPKYNYAERSHDYRWTKPYKTFAKPFWITVCSSYVYSLLCSAITHYTIPWITWVYKWYMHRAWPWHRYAEAGARSRCQLCSLSSSSSSLSSSSLSLSIVAMTQVCWARVSNQGVNQGQGAKQGARSRCQLCCLSSSSSTSSSLSSSSSSYSSSSSSSYAEARCSIRVSIMLLIGNLLWLPSAALRLQWSLTRHTKLCKGFVFQSLSFGSLIFVIWHYPCFLLVINRANVDSYWLLKCQRKSKN